MTSLKHIYNSEKCNILAGSPDVLSSNLVFYSPTTATKKNLIGSSK